MQIYSVFNAPDGRLIVSYTCTQAELQGVADGSVATKPGAFYASAEWQRDRQAAKVAVRQAAATVDLS